MKLGLALLFLAACGSARAQSAADVTRAIAASTHEVVAYLPFAEQLDIADALRVAALRGKRIYLITSQDGVRDPHSFTLRLAHVPGVLTYLASPGGQPFVMIDGNTTFAGSALVQDGAGTQLNALQPGALLAWVRGVTRQVPVKRTELLKLRYVSKAVR